MADNYLITGYWGEPHVTAENDRGFNAAIFGAGKYVLEVGEMFKAEYIGNNTVRLYDGKLIDNGAVAGIPAGTYIDVLIPEAGQGMNRNDLIIFEYSQDTSTLVESGVFKVLSGTETSGTATDPELTESDILSNTATFDQMALWRVSVSGSAISDPVSVFDVAKIAGGAASAYNHLDNSDFSDPVAQAGLNGKHGTTTYAIDRWIAHNLTVAQESGYLKATPTTTYAYMGQKVKVKAGKTYTCAARFSVAGVGEIRVYDEEMTTQLAKVGKISGVGLVSFTVPDAVDIIHVILYPNAANVNSGIVYWAALYEGEYTDNTLPTYTKKGYSTELAECERYFRRLNIRAAGVMPSTTTGYINLPELSNMRISPTVVFENYNGTIAFAKSAARDSQSTISSATLANTVLTFTFNAAVGTQWEIFYIVLPTPVAFCADI